MKRFRIHWFVVVPSLIILAVVGSVLVMVIKFAAHDVQNTGGPTVVNDRYEQGIITLRQKVQESQQADSIIQESRDTLLALRVPQNRLDTHLRAVIQLSALTQQGISASEAKTALLDILEELLKSE